VHVAGDYLAETVGNADEGFVNVGVADAYGVQQRPVRRPLETFFNRIASHNPASPKTVYKLPESPKNAILTAN